MVANSFTKALLAKKCDHFMKVIGIKDKTKLYRLLLIDEIILEIFFNN